MPPASRWVAVIAAAALVAHVAVNLLGPYELHRDALLYLAMGEHLRLFRMDFPPFIALAANATRGLLGDSPAAIRLGPALSHAALILLAGAFARRAGGRAAAQTLAALAVATGPVFLRAGSLFQPVVFDQLWWTLSLYALARIGAAGAGVARAGVDAGPAPATGPGTVRPGDRARDGAHRWWLVLGVTLGLALLTKFTALVLGAAILVGLLVTPERRWLRTPWPWLAAAVALVIGSPGLVGQAALGWPFFTQLDDLQAEQLSRLSPLGFTLDQLTLVGPVVVLAVAGAVALATRERHRPLRAVGWSAIAAFLLMMAAGGKSYYIAPIWPALLGAGMAEAERGWTGLRRRAAATAAAAAVALAVVGFAAVSLPMGLPFLPPPAMARFAARAGVSQAVTTNRGEVLELPQDYADMLGWKEMAAVVTRVWHDLPAADRAQGIILATNYGRAGAIDFYGPGDLPPVLAPVGSYWFWGPGDRPGAVAVVVGAEPEDVRRYFRSAVQATRIARPWGVPEERDVPVVIGRDPIRTLAEVWPEWAGQN